MARNHLESVNPGRVDSTLMLPQYVSQTKKIYIIWWLSWITLQLNKFNAQYATIYLPLVNHPWCKPIRPNNSIMYSPPGRKIHASVVFHLLRRVCHPTNTCCLLVVYSPNSTMKMRMKHHCWIHHCVVNGISIVIRCIRHYGEWLDRGSSMCRSLLMVTLVAVR